MHNHHVSPETLKQWAHDIAYQLDQPGVLVLDEITSVKRDWLEAPYKDDLKFCLASPVTYESVVSNLGMAILYQELNDNGVHPSTTGVLCERAYFPEKKLLTRLEKKGFPLFSKETFTPLKNFDVLGVSSYYPLQYLNIPRILEMSDIPVWSKDRTSDNSPILLGGGISFFNPEPVSDFFDCFFIGEGEKRLHQVLLIAKECRDENGNVDRDKFLFRIAKETDFMYVPSFYDVKYFSGFGVKERTSKIAEAKPVITRALANIYEIPPLTRTFVPVVDSADMSIGSCEISRGCSASCNFPIHEDSLLNTSRGMLPIKEVKEGDSVYCNNELLPIKEIFDRGQNSVVKLTSKHGYSIKLEPVHNVLVLNKFGQLVDKAASDVVLGEDYLVLSRAPQQKHTDNQSLINKAFLAGFIAGDGYFRSDNKTLGFCTVSNALEVENKILDILEVEYGFRPTVRTCHKSEAPGKKRDSTDVRHFDTRNKDLYADIKERIYKNNAYDVVPTDYMLTASFEEQAAFLQGLYEADGTVTKASNRLAVSLTTVSKALAESVQRMFISLGILTNIASVNNEGKKKVIYGRLCNIATSYHVDVITRDSFQRFSRFVRFASNKKNELLDLHISSMKNDINNIPYIAAQFMQIVAEARNSGLLSLEQRRELTRKTAHQRNAKTTSVGVSTLQKVLPVIEDAISQGSFDYLNTFISENYFLSLAVSREDFGTARTMCLDVGEPHHFNAEGLIVHNCEGSARTMPLRERPTDVAIKAFDEVKRETGGMDITPYGFNLSDHSNVRTLIKHLAKDQDVKIQMSSQRIDMFTEDFARVAYLSGNRSVTLAIEGGSQRLRDAVNKNLTTQQIMEAFEIAMKTGFNKVKIYMIANLPFETSEDIDGVPTQIVGKDFIFEGKRAEEWLGREENNKVWSEFPNRKSVHITYEDGHTDVLYASYQFQVVKKTVFAEDLVEGTVLPSGKVASIEHSVDTLYGFFDKAAADDSLVGLMNKLAVRRDYWAQKNGKEMVLNWSFTPFTSKNSTPFQFAGCMGGLTNKKTLTPAVERARELGMKFRVGTSTDTSTIAQVLTLGDRRLNNVIYRAYKEGITQYFGGMSCGADPLEPFENLLKEETGHSYEIYGQEKELNQVFPWDFIDVGMTKEHLKERYLLAKAAMNSPFGCFVRCDNCGACMTSQADLPKTPSGKDYRPFLWRREVSDGNLLDDFAILAKKYKKQDSYRYILEFDVFDVNLRFLDRKKLKLYLQRAYIRSGFPARKKKTFFTDDFKFQNWTYGIDYCVGCLTENLPCSNEEMVAKLNESLEPHGIRAKRLEVYSMNTKAADLFEKVLYDVQTDFDINQVQAGISEFLSKDSFIVKVKVPGMMRGSFVTKEVDAREFVKDIWAEQIEGVTVIRAISTGNIGLYEILPSILHTSAKNVKRFPVRRAAFFKKETEGEFDFFAETCEVSGEQIEKNVFDEPISTRFSARYLPLDIAKVSVGSAFSDDDEESDKAADEVPADNGVYMENDGSTLDASFEDFTPDISDEPEDLSDIEGA